jgi:hypothetical protein
MTDEELDAIVRAIGDESFVSMVRFASWFVPMALSWIPIAGWTGIDRLDHFCGAVLHRAVRAAFTDMVERHS